jgi:hypothetical protein
MLVQASGRQSRSRGVVVGLGRWLSKVMKLVSIMAGSKKLARSQRLGQGGEGVKVPIRWRSARRDWSASGRKSLRQGCGARSQGSRL